MWVGSGLGRNWMDPFLRRSQPGCGGGVKTRVMPFGEGPGPGEEPGRKVGEWGWGPGRIPN